jgi:hypothetical protein
MHCSLRLFGPFLFALTTAPMARAAEPPPVILSWSGPKECPSGERVIARLEHLLSATALSPEPLVVDANVTRDAEGFRLELSTRHENQHFQRNIRAGSCADLADATAVILALLIDPTLRHETSRGSDASVSTKPSGAPSRSASASSSARAAAPDTSQAPGVSARWAALLGPVVDFGSLPTGAPGLELGGMVERKRVMLSVSGIWFPHSKRDVTESSSTGPAKGGTFSLLSGQLRLCYQPFTRLRLAGCGAAELGLLRAKGFGTAVDSDSDVLWAAVGPGLETGIAVARDIVFRAGAEALFGVRRPEFVLGNVGRVYRPQWASVRLALGLVLYFP